MLEILFHVACLQLISEYLSSHWYCKIFCKNCNIAPNTEPSHAECSCIMVLVPEYCQDEMGHIPQDNITNWEHLMSPSDYIICTATKHSYHRSIVSCFLISSYINLLPKQLGNQIILRFPHGKTIYNQCACVCSIKDVTSIIDVTIKKTVVLKTYWTF